MPKARSIVWSAAIILGAASCSRGAHTPSQASTPQVRATQSPAQPRPSAVPSTASPAPIAPVITPTPGSAVGSVPAVPHVTKKVPRVLPETPPQILAIAISETTVAPGDRVSGSVVTTSNVASVQARIGGYAVNLSKTGVGRFALTYTVASLPWFVRGKFTMQVIAKNTRGDTATQAIPITVR